MKSISKQPKITSFWRYLLPLVLAANSTAGYSDDLSNVKLLCDNITSQNRVMAKQAGYDIDVLCSQISSVDAKNNKIAPSVKKVARKTVSSTKAIPAKKTTAPFSLKPFGYDLFANAPTTFAPSASIAVSENYVLGPGDTLDFLFYGKKNITLSLEINREGFVAFPELGPIALAGLTYKEAKRLLMAKVSAQMIGTQVSISMGTLKSMQIFVLGEAFKPGAYTLSSLSTITHALISGGGITNIGSLRNIHLKRKGEIITTLDLYDLLLSGDTSNDVRMQEGDVIYVPTVGEQVSISGQILRPAIYEMKGGETANDLINLAGGLLSMAFPKSARLRRINEDGFLTVLDLNMNQPADRALVLKGADHLIVDRITDYKKDIVTLSGAVRHQGDFSWRDGMTISDIIDSRDKLDHDADLDAALLVREIKNSADIEVFTFNLGNVLSGGYDKDNLKLNVRDKIIVFADYQDRSKVLNPFIANLKRQASIDGMAKIVTASGKVRFPGEYPLTMGMTVQDLISIAGGLVESAYSQSAEISRIDLSNPENAISSIVISDLTVSSSTRLVSSDRVIFRTIPEFREARIVELKGEFVFPGNYVFSKGETLSSVIRRAGGFTNEAFVGGSIFLRESLRKREQNEIDRLIDRLDEEIAGEQLRISNSGLNVANQDFDIQKSAVSSLKDIVATGRMIIPLKDILEGRAEDVLLKDGDRLIMPKLTQEVTIIGEVRRPTSYLFDPKLKPSDYVKKSGGFKEAADKKGIYIVKADGRIVMLRTGPFRLISANSSISAGDTIVVPLDTDDSELRGIPLLSEVSQIIYQLSLGAAAINSLNNN